MILLQSFVDALVSIMTESKVKRIGETADAPKIPLLHANDQAFQVWVHIQDDWLEGHLPDCFGKYPPLKTSIGEATPNAASGDHALVRSSKKAGPLPLSDFQPLYGLRDSEILDLAARVKSKHISVKSSKSKSQTPSMDSLKDAAGLVKEIRLIKNELMYWKGDHPLPSKEQSYVPYTDAEYDALTQRLHITETEISLWHGRLSKTDAGKTFFEKRGRNLNKSSNPKDCPQLLHSLWDAHESNTANVETSQRSADALSENYFHKVSGRGTGNIGDVLYDVDVKAWRGQERKVVLVCPFIDRERQMPIDVEPAYLTMLLRSMESGEGDSRMAHIPGIFIVAEQGFLFIHEYLKWIAQNRKLLVWDVVSVIYLCAANDKLCDTAMHKTTPLYIMFLFGQESDRTQWARFRHYFGDGVPTLLPNVIDAEDFPDSPRQFLDPEKADLNIEAIALALGFVFNDTTVLVNIGGGPTFTHLGLVRLIPLLSVQFCYR